MDRAADIILPKSEFERIYAATQKRRADQERRERRTGQFKSVLIGALVLAVAGEGLVIAARSRTDPPMVFVYQRDDGSVTNSLSYASLPEAVKGKAAINALWTYVRLRESWSAAEAEYAWNVVSAMSSKDVRDQYQTWQEDKAIAPRKLYGEDGQVRTDFISYAPVCDGDKAGACDNPDRMMFRFDRSERRGQAWLKPVRYSVTLRFRHVPRLPVWLVATVNSPGIVITDYPGAQPEGVPQK
jgi:type IV secretion system protein VirB8